MRIPVAENFRSVVLRLLSKRAAEKPMIIAMAGFLAVLWVGLIAPVSSALPQRGEIAADGPVPLTLKDMCDKSELIVEGYVKSVYPSVALPVGKSQFVNIYTDSVLEITRVIKGSAESNEVVVFQLGGTLPDGRSMSPGKDVLMKSGNRYVAFLHLTTGPLMNELPKRDVKRYSVLFGQVGLVGVDDGSAVHLVKDLPFQKDYDLKSKSLFLADVGVYVTPTKER